MYDAHYCLQKKPSLPHVVHTIKLHRFFFLHRKEKEKDMEIKRGPTRFDEATQKILIGSNKNHTQLGNHDSSID